jgi:hypothetical protein
MISSTFSWSWQHVIHWIAKQIIQSCSSTYHYFLQNMSDTEFSSRFYCLILHLMFTFSVLKYSMCRRDLIMIIYFLFIAYIFFFKQCTAFLHFVQPEKKRVHFTNIFNIIKIMTRSDNIRIVMTIIFEQICSPSIRYKISCFIRQVVMRWYMIN